MGVSPNGLWVETHTSGKSEPTSARLYHTLPRPAGEWVAAGLRSSLNYAVGGALTLNGTDLLLNGEDTGLGLEGYGDAAYAPCWLEQPYKKIEFPDKIWKGAHRIQRAFPAPHADLNVGLTLDHAFIYNNHFAIKVLRSEIQTTIPEGMSFSMKLAKHGTTSNVGNPIWTDGVWWCEEVSACGGASAYREHLEFREGEEAITDTLGVAEMFAAADALKRTREERIVPWGDLPNPDDAVRDRCVVGNASLHANLLRAVTSTLAARGEEVLTYGTDKPVMFLAGDIQIMTVFYDRDADFRIRYSDGRGSWIHEAHFETRESAEREGRSWLYSALIERGIPKYAAAEAADYDDYSGCESARSVKFEIV